MAAKKTPLDKIREAITELLGDSDVAPAVVAHLQCAIEHLDGPYQDDDDAAA